MLRELDGNLVCPSLEGGSGHSVQDLGLEPKPGPGPQASSGGTPGWASCLPLSQGPGTWRRRKERLW